jgi:formylmethanofuran dehydrogenase subunit B
MVQALNGPTRAALSTLRGGGNRTGSDAVLTAHTGYPAAVSFAAGFPSYRPFDASLAADAVLIVGDAAQVPAAVMSRLAQVAHAIIGPRATAHTGRVMIDTGIAGIHLGGTALRLDDLPLPLRPALSGHRDPADVLRALIGRLAAPVATSERVPPSGTGAGPAEVPAPPPDATTAAARSQRAGR